MYRNFFQATVIVTLVVPTFLLQARVPKRIPKHLIAKHLAEQHLAEQHLAEQHLAEQRLIEQRFARLQQIISDVMTERTRPQQTVNPESISPHPLESIDSNVIHLRDVTLHAIEMERVATLQRTQARLA